METSVSVSQLRHLVLQGRKHSLALQTLCEGVASCPLSSDPRIIRQHTLMGRANILVWPATNVTRLRLPLGTSRCPCISRPQHQVAHVLQDASAWS